MEAVSHSEIVSHVPPAWCSECWKQTNKPPLTYKPLFWDALLLLCLPGWPFQNSCQGLLGPGEHWGCPRGAWHGLAAQDRLVTSSGSEAARASSRHLPGGGSRWGKARTGACRWWGQEQGWSPALKPQRTRDARSQGQPLLGFIQSLGWVGDKNVNEGRA